MTNFEEKYKHLIEKFNKVTPEAFNTTLLPLSMIYMYIEAKTVKYEDGKLIMTRRPDYELSVTFKDYDSAFGVIKKSMKGIYCYDTKYVNTKKTFPMIDMICKKGMNINNEVKRKLRKFEGVKKIERIYDYSEFLNITDKIREKWIDLRIKQGKIDKNDKILKNNIKLDEMAIRACGKYMDSKDVYMRLFYNNDELFGFSFDTVWEDVLYGMESKTLDYTKYDNTFLYNYLIETSPVPYIEMGMYFFERPEVGKFKEQFTYGIFPYYYNDTGFIKQSKKKKEENKNVTEWFT